MHRFTLFLLFGCFVPLMATAVPPIGEGTEANPYLVSSLDNLQWIAENEDSWDSRFIQTADIDAGPTAGWHSGQGWQPIGYPGPSGYSRLFRGVYDGGLHTVSGLTTNRPDTMYQGMFGCIFYATIRNLCLENYSITCDSFSGGLVAWMSNSVIENCHTYGSIDGRGYIGGLAGSTQGSCTISSCSASGSLCSTTEFGRFVGGLVGDNYGTNISNCFFSGEVSSEGECTGGLVGGCWNGDINDCFARGSISTMSNYTGGLVGYFTQGYVTNCHTSNEVSSLGYYTGGLIGFTGSSIYSSYSTGNVSGGSGTGGLLGYSDGDVWDCYSRGNVNGIDAIGGFIGDYSGMYGRIIRCYSTGEVTGNNDVGGFSGYSGQWYILGCLWDIETSHQTESSGGTGYTTDQMKDISTYLDLGWDFVGETTNGVEDTWAIDPAVNDGYPYLAGTSTAVEDETMGNNSVPGVIPVRNYPNPFNPSTTIEYTLPADAQVGVSIYNARGQLVKDLVVGRQPMGRHIVEWDGRGRTGAVQASGIYFVRVRTDNRVTVHKVMMMK